MYLFGSINVHKVGSDLSSGGESGREEEVQLSLMGPVPKYQRVVTTFGLVIRQF